MKVVLVGSARQRARLHEELGESATVVGEFATLADARDADLDAEAIVIAGRGLWNADSNRPINPNPQSEIRNPQ